MEECDINEFGDSSDFAQKHGFLKKGKQDKPDPKKQKSKKANTQDPDLKEGTENVSSKSNGLGKRSVEKENGAILPIFTAKYYSRYFNVDTTDIWTKIRGAILLDVGPFMSADKYDELYGPTWIIATLLCTILISNSVISLSIYPKDVLIGGNIRILLGLQYKALIAYIFLFILPAVVQLHLKYFGKLSNDAESQISEDVEPLMSFINIVCMYGYCFSIFVPLHVLIITFTPLAYLNVTAFNVIRFALLLSGYLISTFFLVRGLGQLFRESSGNNKNWYFFVTTTAILHVFPSLILNK